MTGIKKKSGVWAFIQGIFAPQPPVLAESREQRPPVADVQQKQALTVDDLVTALPSSYVPNVPAWFTAFLSNIEEAGHNYVDANACIGSGRALNTFISRMVQDANFAETLAFIMSEYSPPRVRRFLQTKDFDTQHHGAKTRFTAPGGVLEIHPDGRQIVYRLNGYTTTMRNHYSDVQIEEAINIGVLHELTPQSRVWESIDFMQHTAFQLHFIAAADAIKGIPTASAAFALIKAKFAAYNENRSHYHTDLPALADSLTENLWNLVTRSGTVDPAKVEPLNRKDIFELAIAHGFKTREQPDGEDDLNSYVYTFAEDIERRVRLEVWREITGSEAYPPGMVVAMQNALQK